MPKTYIHPDTGDELTRTEMISWKAQGLIRRWSFIMGITLITAVVFTLVAVEGNASSSSVLFWWNASASYMALLIESIVGLSMFAQTKRDAQILRKIDRVLDKMDLMLDKVNSNEEELIRIEKQELLELAELNDRFDHDKS